MEHLLQVEGLVTPVSTQSHVTYSFFIPKPYDRLHFDYCYQPKNLEDRQIAKNLIEQSIRAYEGENSEKYLQSWESYLPLKNHITLSFDDSQQQFRGATHRHDPELHLVLSETEASPGLVPGLILPGQWKVTLSMHAVVTDKCQYMLDVWGEME